MKLLRILSVFAILFVFACESESADVNNPDPDPGSETDDGPSGTVTVSLVNAFQNLSFDQPLDLQAPNDGSNRIFVAEKTGRIKVFDNDPNVSSTDTFIDLSGTLSTSSEQGIIGFAFHPSFANNGYVYVHYNPNAGVSYISRFTVSAGNANALDPSSELVIMQIDQPETNHNGGQLAFGSDGYLYIAVGDGGGGGDPDNNAQNRGNLLGNILRIDVDNPANGANYGIPSNNPFVGEANVREEIYAFGLRNPWRMSFDTQTNDLWTADVGQGELEEIDLVVAGGNYGWRLFEGTACYSGNCDDTGLIAPIFEYNHDNGDRSVTGGFVYRGSEVSTLQGRYVYGDFVSGRIWSMELDGTDNVLFEDTGLGISSFGTDADQELYVCDFSGGIYKFVETTD